MDQLGTALLVVVLGLVLKEVIVLGRHLHGKNARDKELTGLAVMVSDVNARLTNLQGEVSRVRDQLDRLATDIGKIQLALADLGYWDGRGGAR